MPQDHVDKKGKKGRPLKKDYDAETLMQELIDTAGENDVRNTENARQQWKI